MRVRKLQFSSVSSAGLLLHDNKIETLFAFLGNISEKIPDGMIKKIIAACGPVANWKRVSTFGFCEYE
jgi:hypothetical protein